MIEEDSNKTNLNHCKYCGNILNQDQIDKIFEGQEAIICELCGAKLKKKHLETMHNLNTDLPLAKLARQMRTFTFRRIYEILNTLEFIEKIKNGQKELTKEQAECLAKNIRKSLLNEQIPAEWLENALVSRIHFSEYYDEFIKIISNKNYKAEYLESFQEWAQDVFEFISGKKKISNFQEALQVEIIEALKKNYGFTFNQKNPRTFEYFFTILASRYIYDRIKNVKLETVPNKQYTEKLASSFITDISNDLTNGEKILDVFPKRIKRFIKRKFEKLLIELSWNQIYRESFLDYTRTLIETILNLIKEKNDFSDLQGIKLDIAEDLASIELFKDDERFSVDFKGNLIVILSRIIYVKIKSLANLTDIVKSEITDYLMTELLTQEQINHEYLKNLNQIRLNDFNAIYQKFRLELISDNIYTEGFRNYLFWFIDILNELISGQREWSTLSNVEKTLIYDLKNLKPMGDAYDCIQTLKSDKSPKKSNTIRQQKGHKSDGLTITRKFALIPDVERWDQKKEVYKQMTNIMIKIRSLKDVYARKMAEYAKAGNSDAFNSTTLTASKRVYMALSLNKIDAPAFHGRFALKERVKRSAAHEVHQAIHNWLERASSMNELITYISKKIKTDYDFALRFLSGKKLFYSELKDILLVLKNSSFSSSADYLNTRISQLRNLLLRECDFPCKELTQLSPDNNALTKSLIKYTTSKVVKYLRATNPSNAIISDIIGGFTRKKGNRTISIAPHALPSYLLNRYFQKISASSTFEAKGIIALVKEIQTLQRSGDARDKAKSHALLKKAQQAEAEIQQHFGEIQILHTDKGTITYSSLKQFKATCKNALKRKKTELQRKIDGISELELERVAWDAFQDEIRAFTSRPEQHFLRRLCKPYYPKITIPSIDYAGFLVYLSQKFRYKIRKFLVRLFLTNKSIKLLAKMLKEMSKAIYDLLKIPQFTALSLGIIDKQLYKADYEKLEAQLRLIPRNFVNLRVMDKERVHTLSGNTKKVGRIESLITKGFIPHLPVISLTGRKIILNLPFELKKGRSKQYHVTTDSHVVLGVDLGLKHFAVVSVYNEKAGKEIARYFLGAGELFHKQFDMNRGKFQLQPQYLGHGIFPLSNIKLKLINLRAQARKLQKKKDDYEQRLLERGISHFRLKYKWNMIRKSLSLVWARIHRLNVQIIHYLSHDLVQIARYHRASIIKMENLKWSSHSKKRDTGKFLAFWQTHWFFAQIQQSVELQCQFFGIGFKRVSARNTSRNCSRCGTKGIRRGSLFHCPSCSLQLNADLNASRNISLSPSDHYKRKKYTLTAAIGVS